MFVCDYVLVQKRSASSGTIEDVIINVSSDVGPNIKNLASAWYLGQADGASCARIVLINKRGVEFILPLRMGDSDSAEAIHDYFMTTRAIKVSELGQKSEAKETYNLPVTGFASEQAMILSALPH